MFRYTAPPEPATLPGADRSKNREPFRSPLSVLEAPPLPSRRTPNLNRSAADFAKNREKFPNKINGENFAISEARPAVPAVPLDVVNGHRWAGASSPERHRKIRAAVDAELGTPSAEPTTRSTGGVRNYVAVPRRRGRP
jgi:hypothetical protein